MTTTADNIDRSEPTPENQLWHARQLSDSELQRHASVCLDNRCPGNHEDKPESFTCACVVVARERGLLAEDGQLKQSEARMEIYDELKATGVEIASHESDLYVPVTPLTRAIVDRYRFCPNVKTFTDQATGQPWFDIPFAYAPFWEAKTKGRDSLGK